MKTKSHFKNLIECVGYVSELIVTFYENYITGVVALKIDDDILTFNIFESKMSYNYNKILEFLDIVECDMGGIIKFKDDKKDILIDISDNPTKVLCLAKFTNYGNQLVYIREATGENYIYTELEGVPCKLKDGYSYSVILNGNEYSNYVVKLNEDESLKLYHKNEYKLMYNKGIKVNDNIINKDVVKSSFMVQDHTDKGKVDDISNINYCYRSYEIDMYNAERR